MCAVMFVKGKRMNRLPSINLGPQEMFNKTFTWKEANLFKDISDYNRTFNQSVTGNPRSILKATVQFKDKKNNLLLQILNGIKNGDIKYQVGLKQSQLLTGATLRECMNFLRLAK